MPTHPEKDPKVTPTPAPAPAAGKLDPDELSDEDLDKVSGGFAQVAAGTIPGGRDPLL